MATDLPEPDNPEGRGDDEVAPAAGRSLVGQLLCGKWRLERMLGSGGMSSVYAAVHRNGKRVAIKVLSRDLADNQQVRSRFMREGYIANRIGHEGTVAVLDDDADGDIVFLVMELLDGETLGARARRLGGMLAPEEVAFATDGLLEVLAAAHAHGIVHRDVKPDNVFCTRAGQIKLLDFGIARLREISFGLRQTRVGRALGTPGFMAPEQASGRWEEVDARTDLWAVGATMFRLLTGRAVHPRGRALDAMTVAATQPAPSLATRRPDLAGGLVDLVDRALAFAPPERWQSAEQMQAAVRQVRAALPAHVWRPPPPEPPGNDVETVADEAVAAPARSFVTGPPSARTSAPEPAQSWPDRASTLPPAASPRGYRALVAAAVFAAAVGSSSYWLWPRLRGQPAPRKAAGAAAIVAADEAARAYLDEAERFARAKALGPAVDMLTKARELEIKDPDLNIRLIRLNDEIEIASAIGRSRSFLAVGDAKQAAEMARRALERDPGNAEALRLMAIARKTPGHEAAAPAVVAKPPAAPALPPTEPVVAKPAVAAAAQAARQPAAPVRVAAAPVPPPETAPVRVAAPPPREAAPVHSAAPRVEAPAARAEAAPPRLQAASAPPVPASPTASPHAPAPAGAPPANAGGSQVSERPRASIPPPRLPRSYEARDNEDLARACELVERETIANAGVTPAFATGVTTPLRRALERSGGAVIYPVGMYYFIISEAGRGRKKEIAGQNLLAAQRSKDIRKLSELPALAR